MTGITLPLFDLTVKMPLLKARFMIDANISETAWALVFTQVAWIPLGPALLFRLRMISYTSWDVVRNQKRNCGSRERGRWQSVLRMMSERKKVVTESLINISYAMFLYWVVAMPNCLLSLCRNELTFFFFFFSWRFNLNRKLFAHKRSSFAFFSGIVRAVRIFCSVPTVHRKMLPFYFS